LALTGYRKSAASRGRTTSIIAARGPKASAPARTGALVALVALTVACGRGNDWRTPAQSSQSASAEASYAPPPRFTAAARLGDGDVEVVGRAHRNAQVRLTSPDGSSLAAVTDSRGAFSVAVPRSGGVRLFGLAEDVGGRQVRGVGYLAVVPSPGQAAVVLRAGTGAEALGVPSAAPKISAVDFDVSGLAVVSGLARPGSAVRLSVDGAGGVDGRANTQGRYAITLTTALKAGDHQLQVQSPLGQAAVRFRISPAAPISGLPFRGARQSNGWRLDWLTPAGGEQTTLVVD
jgi:hypothetical protein